MAFDISTLLARPITLSERRRAYALDLEVQDMRLAELAVTMQRHLMTSGGLEEVLETLMINGADPSSLVRGVRLYVLTGHRPSVRHRRA